LHPPRLIIFVRMDNGLWGKIVQLCCIGDGRWESNVAKYVLTCLFLKKIGLLQKVGMRNENNNTTVIFLHFFVFISYLVC